MKNIKRIIEHTKKTTKQYFFQIFALIKKGFYILNNTQKSNENLLDFFESCGFEEIISMREPDLNEPYNSKKYKAYFIVPVESKTDLTFLYSLLSDPAAFGAQSKKEFEKLLSSENHTLKAEDCNYSLIVISVDREHNTSSLITVFPALTGSPFTSTV